MKEFFITFGFLVTLFLSSSIMQISGVIGFSSFAFAKTVSKNLGINLFKTRCASCHTLGGGKTIGPDLRGVSARRKRIWIERFIKEPSKVIAEKDPIAMKLLAENNQIPMPALNLTKTELIAIVDFLFAQDHPKTSSINPNSKSIVHKNSLSLKKNELIQKGKAYFQGDYVFKNGGISCMSCHHVQGITTLGGGSLGPDLTLAAQKFGGAGMFVFFDASPTMKAVYQNHPVTQKERHDLLSFFMQTSKSNKSLRTHSTQASWSLSFLGMGIGGCVILLFLVGLLWKNRLEGIRKSMVLKSKI